MKEIFDQTRELNCLENAEAKVTPAQNQTYEKDGNAVGIRPIKKSVLEKLSSADTLGVGDIDIRFGCSKDLPRPADLD